VWELLFDGVVDSIEVHLLTFRRQMHPILLDTHRLHRHNMQAVQRHVRCATLQRVVRHVCRLNHIPLTQQSMACQTGQWTDAGLQHQEVFKGTTCTTCTHNRISWGLLQRHTVAGALRWRPSVCQRPLQGPSLHPITRAVCCTASASLNVTHSPPSLSRP
jgi:hypothetical protein